MDATASCSKTMTMGELSSLVPEGDERRFKTVLELVRKYYPPGWEKWEIQNHSFENLFGGSMSPEIEKKIRFALPTVELIQAIYPDSPNASERSFRDLKRRLLNWSFGRALLYSPHNIMEKIHYKSHNVFMDTVAKLKPLILSRQSAFERLQGFKRTSTSTERSISPQARTKRIRSPSPTQTDPPKRHCPTPPALSAKSEDLLSLLLEQQVRQNKMFERIVQLSQNQEEKMSKIEMKLEHRSPDSAPEDLNVSFADSTYSENFQDEDDEEAESNATPPNIWTPIKSNDADENKGAQISQEESLRIQIIDAQRKLLELQKENPQPQTTETNIDFSPLVVESQVKIAKADPELAKQGSRCQRLGEDTWKNIRYADVQKQFQATPVFTSLKVNSHLALATPFWHSVSILERIDSTLAAISHGLLQQRKHFEECCQNLSPELKSQANKELLGPESKFKKTSDALLQYTCGKRSEIIHQRRQLYKASNKALNEILHDIPPSDTHLFSEKSLSEVVKDHGGPHKMFPAKSRKPSKNKQTASSRNFHNNRKNFTNKEPFRGNTRRDNRKTTKPQYNNSNSSNKRSTNQHTKKL
ncbi:unnamed protein product [Chilo suppressalis]|uniref:NAB co-repressor domain-containing protein n=1 Tax=Chilo suppressalis TaxID=168631 RepID=A0ABN8AZ68_CHISP|nr:unnamed protein product [Chilo suppressalis]